jgi:twinkle protein
MIADELTTAGINFKTQGTQFVITCPMCFKKDHCYVNQTTGAWDCKVCFDSGGFGKLMEAITGAKISEPLKEQAGKKLPTKADIDQRMHRLLGPNGTSAIEYLTKRGITTEAIHHFKLGLEKRGNGEWLCIPYFENGEPVNMKCRRLPPAEKTFTRWEGGKSILFNQDALKDLPPESEIIVVEGEIDCISMWVNGFRACVSTSLGAGSFQPVWVDVLDRFERIYFMYDSDAEGQKGACKHADRFSPDKVFNVILPVKDANDFFCQGHDAEELGDLLNKARPFDIENILTMDQVHESLIRSTEEKVKSRIKPQWASVARLTGPYEAGDLIVVTATPKTGKTTWTLNDALQWAKDYIAVLFYCLEMRPERLLRKCYQIEMQVAEDGLRASDMVKAHKALSGIPLCFGYNYRKCTLDIVLDTIRRGVRRFGFEIVIFDNLHFLSRSITHQVQELGVISKSFKLLAEELRIPIIVIAQPNRGDDPNRVVGINDLKGSSDIGADADQIIALWRKKRKSQENQLAEAAFEPETLVRVDASRFRSGGDTVLYFVGETGIFTEIMPAEEATRNVKAFERDRRSRSPLG